MPRSSEFSTSRTQVAKFRDARPRRRYYPKAEHCPRISMSTRRSPCGRIPLTGLRNMLPGLPRHSGLMPANLITLAHFSVSAAMSFAEISRRARIRHAPQRRVPRSHIRIGQARINLRVELLDDLDWRALRRAEATRCAGLVTRHEFANGRQLGERPGACGRRHREGPQLTSPDISDGRRCKVEHHLHLTADQVSERRRGASIRHVKHFDASHHLEQLTSQVRRVADACPKPC